MKIVCCLLLLILALNGNCAEKVGQVTALEGLLTTVGADQVARTLQVDSGVYVGDLLMTHEAAKGEITFTDGTKVLLIPHSQYSVDDYHAGSGINRYAARLRRGGIQISTGMIAKKNPENFQLGTPNATIGVRGTTFVARMFNGELFAGSSAGTINLTNTGGTLSIKPNQFGVASSMNTLPQSLAKMPDALNPSNFLSPGLGLPASTKASFAWGPAIGSVAVIGVIVGVVAAVASQKASSYSGTPQPTISHQGRSD